MKQALLLLLISASFTLAQHSWELTLLWNQGNLTLEQSRILEGSPKKSRRSSSSSGPASNWSWQVVDGSGTVLNEKRFVLPVHLCTGDKHVHVDSTRFVILIPQSENGESVRIVESGNGAVHKSGDLPQSRSAETVVAEFPLSGGAL